MSGSTCFRTFLFLAPFSVQRSLSPSQSAVHERKSGFAGGLELVYDACKQSLLFDLLIHEGPEEVLCRIVLFFDAECHDLVDHLRYHFFLAERVFEDFQYGTPAFRHKVHHLKPYIIASVRKVIRHSCRMFPLFVRVALHPMCKSVPSLAPKEIGHLEIKVR